MHIDWRENHSPSGSRWKNTYKMLGKLPAYAIAGHHAGRLDGKSNDACLYKWLKKESIPASARS